MDIYHDILFRYWGYTKFRPLQEEIIHSIGSGKDTLGLMPTGGGKSLTFQVPVMSMDGICIVITPLIALMKDQVDNLKDRGLKALAVYSGMTHQEILTTLDNAVLGDYKFLYISPERIGTTLFQTKLKSMNVCMLVVDEAHCISQWGYDFRPSYMNIVKIKEYLPNTPILALTATATSSVVSDIQTSLQFKEKNVFRKSFERQNLAYIVYETENKQGALIKTLDKIQGSAIVYVRSRLKTKEIAQDLQKAGYSADYYHAGLKSDEKSKKQAAWKNNQCRIIVSTNAFGMGIDKPDVRLVVHLDLPNSLEEYYQEAGRAGRDEQKAYAVIMYHRTDSTKLKKRITDEFPDREFILKVYDSLAYFLQIADGFGMGSVFDFNLHEFCSVYKLPILPTHNALKILTLAGYIEYTEEVENKSRLLFTVYRDELYQSNLDEEYDLLVNTILRQYTGIFTDYVYIDEASIAIRINKTRKEVYEMLKMLSKRNIVSYVPHKKTPFIIYTQPRTNTKYLSISRLVYEDRNQRFKTRIESMIDYVDRTDVCRSRMLLMYFGDSIEHDCGQCDVCIAKSKGSISTSQFNDVALEIKKALYNASMSIEELTKLLSKDYDEKIVIDVVRYYIDKGLITIDLNKLAINPN